MVRVLSAESNQTESTCVSNVNALDKASECTVKPYNGCNSRRSSVRWRSDCEARCRLEFEGQEKDLILSDFFGRMTASGCVDGILVYEQVNVTSSKLEYNQRSNEDLFRVDDIDDGCSELLLKHQSSVTVEPNSANAYNYGDNGDSMHLGSSMTCARFSTWGRLLSISSDCD